jgi:lipoprotein signal peptidase
MKLRNLYLVHSLVELLFSLALLLIPATILAAYGLGSSKAEILLGQFYGVELLTGGLLTLLARDITDSNARSAINYSLISSGAVGMIIAIGGTVSHTMNALGWSAVVIYAFFAIAFAYFQFFNPQQ